MKTTKDTSDEQVTLTLIHFCININVSDMQAFDFPVSKFVKNFHFFACQFYYQKSGYVCTLGDSVKVVLIG